jgi:HPr Serine kinase C-terminal domain
MIALHNFGREHQLRSHLVISGTRCALSTNDSSVIDCLQRWTATEAGPAHFHLDVIRDDRLPAVTTPAVFRGMGHLVLASIGSNYFGFDLVRKRITAVVNSESASDEKFWNELLVPLAMGVMGCSIGVVPLHSACLEWQGKGILIAGQSGAGKSTLAAAMAQSGFAFISDDWTYISKTARDLSAYGLNPIIKLLPDSDRFFGLKGKHKLALSMNGEWAFEVNSNEFAPKRKTATYPTCLFLLERSGNGHTGFEPLDSDCVRDLFERSSERLPGILNEGREFRSSVIDDIAQLRCWRLTYSGTPHQGADSIRGFLEGRRV